MQVLGNAELRERYDAGGQKALDINFMEVRAPCTETHFFPAHFNKIWRKFGPGTAFRNFCQSACQFMQCTRSGNRVGDPAFMYSAVMVVHVSRVCCAQGAEFFTALFGSERFEHLVGELMIAAAARVGGDLGASQLRKLQVRVQPVAAHGVVLLLE